MADPDQPTLAETEWYLRFKAEHGTRPELLAQDAPLIIAEIDRLQAEVARLRAENVELRKRVDRPRTTYRDVTPDVEMPIVRTGKSGGATGVRDCGCGSNTRCPEANCD